MTTPHEPTTPGTERPLTPEEAELAAWQRAVPVLSEFDHLGDIVLYLRTVSLSRRPDSVTTALARLALASRSGIPQHVLALGYASELGRLTETLSRRRGRSCAGVAQVAGEALLSVFIEGVVAGEVLSGRACVSRAYALTCLHLQSGRRSVLRAEAEAGLARLGALLREGRGWFATRLVSDRLLCRLAPIDEADRAGRQNPDFGPAHRSQCRSLGISPRLARRRYEASRIRLEVHNDHIAALRADLAFAREEAECVRRQWEERPATTEEAVDGLS